MGAMWKEHGKLCVCVEHNLRWSIAYLKSWRRGSNSNNYGRKKRNEEQNATKFDNVICTSSRFRTDEKPLELNYVCWRSFQFRCLSSPVRFPCIRNKPVTNVPLKRTEWRTNEEGEQKIIQRPKPPLIWICFANI